ncbi:uncharacterized protein LOC143902142 [Temnothorax americanus]|uniref:uncharacterized protein LOC143902142 n=1 Tax=Temnothorax americanus TaxID=1964332 RepID=UPI0040693E3F
MRLVAAPTPTIPGLLSLSLAWLRGTTQSRSTTPHRNNRFNFSIAFHQWMFMQSRAAPSSLIGKQKIYLLNIVYVAFHQWKFTQNSTKQFDFYQTLLSDSFIY